MTQYTQTEEIEAMKVDYKCGVSISDIADKYGYSGGVIKLSVIILRGRF